MKCEKCMYCIQVAANEYKVKCANKNVAEDKKLWVDEPSHCVFYEKGNYMKDIFRKKNLRLNILFENEEQAKEYREMLYKQYNEIKNKKEDNN